MQAGLLSREKTNTPGCRRHHRLCGRQHGYTRNLARGSLTLRGLRPQDIHASFSRGIRKDLRLADVRGATVRAVNPRKIKTAMNRSRRSDSCVVPVKLPNKGRRRAAGGGGSGGKAIWPRGMGSCKTGPEHCVRGDRRYGIIHYTVTRRETATTCKGETCLQPLRKAAN